MTSLQRPIVGTIKTPVPHYFMRFFQAALAAENLLGGMGEISPAKVPQNPAKRDTRSSTTITAVKETRAGSDKKHQTSGIYCILNLVSLLKSKSAKF